jgi:hypothetical protein
MAPQGSSGVQGPQAIQGPASADGAIGPRSTGWFTGTVAPPAVIADAVGGDLYLDLATGTVYVLGTIRVTDLPAIGSAFQACFSAASSVMATALGIISTEPPRFSEPTTMAPPRVLRSTGPPTRATITGRPRPASLRQRLVEDLDAVAGAHGHLDPVEVGAGFTGAGPDRQHLPEGQRISIHGVIAVELGGGHELLHAVEAEGVAEVGVVELAL